MAFVYFTLLCYTCAGALARGRAAPILLRLVWPHSHLRLHFLRRPCFCHRSRSCGRTALRQCRRALQRRASTVFCVDISAAFTSCVKLVVVRREHCRILRPVSTYRRSSMHCRYPAAASSSHCLSSCSPQPKTRQLRRRHRVVFSPSVFPLLQLHIHQAFNWNRQTITRLFSVRIGLHFAALQPICTCCCSTPP